MTLYHSFVHDDLLRCERVNLSIVVASVKVHLKRAPSLIESRGN